MTWSQIDLQGRGGEGTPTRVGVAHRLALVRRELFGEHGIPELARRLNLPARTWINYECGVNVPGDVLLEFLELTSVEPAWLRRGTGPRYRSMSLGDSQRV
jgi:hypothetical protein